MSPNTLTGPRFFVMSVCRKELAVSASGRKVRGNTHNHGPPGFNRRGPARPGPARPCSHQTCRDPQKKLASSLAALARN